MDSETPFGQGKHPREEHSVTDEESDSSPTKKLSLSSDLSCGALAMFTFAFWDHLFRT